MTTSTAGVLLDGDLTGTVWSGGHCTKVIVAATSPLIGTATIAGVGLNVTLPAGFNGTQSLPDLWRGTWFTLSNAADVGKIYISFQPI